LLARQDPQLKDAARRYFQGELFGKTGLEKPVTPEKFTKFMSDNERALDQLGLKNEFVAMRDKMSGAAESVEQLRLAEKVKQGDVKAVQQAFDEAESAKKISSEAAQKYRTLSTELDSAKSVEQVAAKTKQIMKALVDDGRVSQAEYGDTLNKINSLVEQKAHREKIIGVLKQAGLTALLVLGGGWAAYHVGRVFTGL
jgi:hypothetical protein